MPSQRTLTLVGIFGVLVSMVGLAWDALMFFSDVKPTSAATRFYRLFAIVGTPLDLLLLLASVMALCHRKSAARLLRGWAIVAIVYAIVRAAWAFAVVAPAATAAARKAATGQPPSEFTPEFAGMFFSIIAIMAFAVTCILSIGVIVAMRSPKASG